MTSTGECLRGALLILLITLFSCSTTKHYGLNEVPVYDTEAADENWKPIAAVHAQYHLMVQAMSLLRTMNVELSDKQKAQAVGHIDVYLFHTSAATIELYHGDYPASRKSIDKAEVAVLELGKLIRQIIEGRGI